MSFLARYCSSRRRRPTRSSSPRRLWWSCLWSLRCSVSSAIRLVRTATCTSGDPVSAGTVAKSSMICFLAAVSSDTALLRVLAARRTGACPPGLSGSAAVLRRFEGISGWRGALTSSEAPRLGHVEGHLLEQGVDTVELERRAKTRTEVEGDPLAIEVEAGPVQAVRLHAALRAVEGRVGADADGRRQTLPRGSEQPAGVDPVGRDGSVPADLEVRGGVAERASPVVAMDDLPLQAVRSTQDCR